VYGLIDFFIYKKNRLHHAIFRVRPRVKGNDWPFDSDDKLCTTETTCFTAPSGDVQVAFWWYDAPELKGCIDTMGLNLTYKPVQQKKKKEVVPQPTLSELIQVLLAIAIIILLTPFICVALCCCGGCCCIAAALQKEEKQKKKKKKTTHHPHCCNCQE
jgi:hypothetical protein